MLLASEASANPSASSFKSPTTFSTSKKLPPPWGKLPAKTPPNKKPRTPLFTASNARTKLRATSPQKPSPNSHPTPTAPRASAKLPNTSSNVAPDAYETAASLKIPPHFGLSVLSATSVLKSPRSTFRSSPRGAINKLDNKLPMKSRPPRTRLDLALVERGLAESQQKAQAMILAGEVRLDGVLVQKAGMPVANDAQLEVKSRRLKYAGRGGLKLQGALEDFAINPAGLVCLDVGSSTGGFTDCLLQHGAARVYAVDVNLAQLAWKLQRDSRVIAIERNARELQPGDLSEPVDLVVADVSFISVCKILGPASLAAK